MGRRGPLQAAFTIAELREILKLENCKTYWRSHDFIGVKEAVSNLPRPRKRLSELMLKSLDEASLDIRTCVKEFHPLFLRGPIEFTGSKSIEKVILSINQLEGDDLMNQTAIPTGDTEEIACNLAVRSIGYKSIQIDQNIPFDVRNGRVLNTSGKVEDTVYAAGWVATGPIGVILSTMNNAFGIGQLVSKELDVITQKTGYYEIEKILKQKNISPVSYKGWEKIDKEERKRGKKLGKPREKIVDINEMLEIALN